MCFLFLFQYLDFDNLPDTNFSCVGKVIGGYYADLETSCQMFHVCTIGQHNEPMDIRFLCLNGTVFDQVIIYELYYIYLINLLLFQHSILSRHILNEYVAKKKSDIKCAIQLILKKIEKFGKYAQFYN